jgi:hypothetical protein
MGNGVGKPVWIKLIIDGENVGQAFQVEIKSETNNVDHLKKAIKVEAKRLNIRSFDGGSLLVYPPRTDLSVEGVEAEPLPPYLRLSDPDFPKGIAGPTPLIVTAKSRQQQQQQTHKAVSFTKRWNILYFGTCLPNTHSSRATVTVAADQ